MWYETRSKIKRKAGGIESTDILVGIPCYNNEQAIAHVIQMVTHSIARHYKDNKSVILIADGGSTDDTMAL